MEERSKEDEARVFSVGYMDRIRGNGHKVKYRKLNLNGRKIFSFALRLGRHWKRCPERLWNFYPWANPTGYGSKQPALNTQTELETPESSVSLWDSVTKMCRTECRCTEEKMSSRIKINENADLNYAGWRIKIHFRKLE